MRRINETQELKLGYAQGIPRSYSKKSQATKLGDAQGIPPFFFNNYRLVSVEPKFLLVHMMCAILGCVFVLLAVWIKCQDLKLFIEREPLHSYLIALLLAWSLLIYFWSSLPFALVLHLYLFEHGVLSYFWRKALMLHLDLFESLWNFVESLSCFTYTFLRDRNLCSCASLRIVGAYKKRHVK